MTTEEEKFVSIKTAASIIQIETIIIINKGRQCKVEREWYTPYQSKDPSPTIPTNRQK